VHAGVSVQSEHAQPEGTPVRVQASITVWEFVKTKVLVPPVVGVLLGAICSSLPPTFYLFCGGTYGESLPAGQTCPADNAILGFLTKGLSNLGDAAVPLNLILLGNSLTSGPDWEALPLRCAIGIMICKMVIMPCVGLGTSAVIDIALGPDFGGLGWLRLRDPCDEVLYLACVAVTATPTANNLLVMTELAGGNKAAMSTSIFLQYLAAPLILTASLTVSIVVMRSF